MKRRIASMEAWLENPVLMEADKEDTYHKVFEIDLNTITEPILCAPNDPDDARTLSSVAGQSIDEVFIGSCMANQARVADKSTVVSTSIRNFPNRLGTGANVFLASAELAAVAAILGRLPTKDEYLKFY